MFTGPVYTSEEVAEHYRVKVTTVQRWVREARITALNLGGSRSGPYVFRSADLEAFECQARVGRGVR